MALDLLPTTISSSPLNGNFNFDVLTQVIYYSAVSATADFEVNFRGDSVTSFASSVPVGFSIVALLYVRTDALNPFVLTEVTVDGAAPIIKGWFGMPVAADTTKYTFTITQSSAGVFIVA